MPVLKFAVFRAFCRRPPTENERGANTMNGRAGLRTQLFPGGPFRVAQESMNRGSHAGVEQLRF
jgi:hypothetical protein